MLILIIVLIISLSIIGCGESPEGIVARVNEEEITIEHYEKDLQIRQAICEKNNRELELEEDILEEIILETIISQEAKKEKISVSDKEVEDTINKDIEEIGSKEELVKELDSIGVSFDYYEDFLRRQNLFEKYKEFIMKDIEISKKNSREYFQENKEDFKMVKVSHILIDSEEEGREILKRLGDDEEFSDLAIENSVDSISAIDGGDLGYISRDTLKNKEIEKAAFKMEKGQISDLIETKDGYHIIYIKDIKEDFEDVEDDVIKLFKEKGYKSHIQKLQNDSKIKKYLEVKDQ